MSAVLAPRPTVVLNQTGEAADALLVSAGLPVALAADPSAQPWTRAGEVDVLFTGPRNGWRDAPAQAPAGWPGRLQWVHLASAGIDFFPPWLLDVPLVTCSRGVAAVPIAEYVLAALLTHEKAWDSLKVDGASRWRDTFQRVDRQPSGTLQGRTLGIAGYGAIGREVARLAQAFGMQVTALRRGGAPVDGLQSAGSIEELLATSDHLVLALPITPETHHLVNAATLAHARPGLHLVNIARGALVDQQALLQALDEGRLSGATLDVTDPEPLPEGHRLYRHPRVRLTPHVSWAAQDAGEVTARKFLANLSRFLAEQPLEDVVDPGRGY
ncbi:MAG: NAD(P)-dependent oxidoreductase [Pseudomonadota bacterium]